MSRYAFKLWEFFFYRYKTFGFSVIIPFITCMQQAYHACFFSFPVGFVESGIISICHLEIMMHLYSFKTIFYCSFHFLLDITKILMHRCKSCKFLMFFAFRNYKIINGCNLMSIGRYRADKILLDIYSFSIFNKLF